jgi:ubiquinone/menaquinone biosynthesis C-methylase UbiE
MTGEIKFNDGAAYEDFMGKWSRLVGERFLAWLGARHGARWLDVGCGNGAFTELIVERCAPSFVEGIDPSPEQIDYARKRVPADRAAFHVGDSMALPFASGGFDVSAMALVLFFVPEPARGVAEMVRATRPGGLVASYAWDILEGGFPVNDVFVEMKALGMTPPYPPSVEAAGLEASRALWKQASLESVQTTQITVERSFRDAEDYWTTLLKGPGSGGRVKAIEPGQREALRKRVFARLGEGQVRITARANAIQGRVPG